MDRWRVRQIENIMFDFVHGDYDVLIATTIIESGLDIPNTNTIFINNAHHFGLSDLHQLTGTCWQIKQESFLLPPGSAPESAYTVRPSGD
ncbi:MAG: helicase-related protein [Bacteroidales bacterium]|nr:helicase-related protein [Bacteroidales bacterium]